MKPWSTTLRAIIIFKINGSSPVIQENDQYCKLNELLADVDSDEDLNKAINFNTDIDEEEIKKIAREDSKDKEAIEKFN